MPTTDLDLVIAAIVIRHCIYNIQSYDVEMYIKVMHVLIYLRTFQDATTYKHLAIQAQFPLIQNNHI